MALINSTGITNGGTIESEHITRIIDALSSNSTDTLSMTGSLQGTASFATTSSYALNSPEYMTLRLSYTQTNTVAATTNYIGLNAASTAIDRVGIRLPYACTIVRANVYSNTTVTAGGTCTITPTLQYDVTGTPTQLPFGGNLNLDAFIDASSVDINTAGSANRWINLKILENNDSTAEFTVTCDVVIKKTV